VRLLRTNLDSFHSRIEYAALPLTFRESIRTANLLGTKFIWIDHDRDDWLRESAEMANVYSYLKISATASSNGDGGLFRERRPSMLQPLYVDYERQKYVVWLDRSARELDRAPLARWAWV
jgi:hypothetical protein